MNSPATDWLPPGYSPLRLLGQGGMGEVWLATTMSGATRAVKRLRLDGTGIEAAADRLRFKREFIAISKVKHPGIIIAHELFETPGNILYTMDFVEGWPLKEYFTGGHWNNAAMGTPDYFRSEAGVLKVFEAAGRILEILAGLHRHQIIHRDLKSANLLAGQNGAITLIDFGLARSEQEDFSITSAGEVMGTPLYISPEQIQGQPLDGRCDLYTLGAMLYELATGAPPFQDKGMAALLLAHLQRPPAPPIQKNPLIPAWQSDFLLKLLAKSPAGRFSTAAAALAALRQAARGSERNLDGEAHSHLDSSAEATAGPHLLSAAVGHGVLLVTPFSGNPGAAQAVRDACEELRQGLGGTLLVSGPAGYGKSKLNDEARAVAAQLGLSIWQGGGRVAGGQIGQIFQDIFTQVAAELERHPGRAALWLKEDGAVLAHHFPALRILPGLENPQLPELEPAGVRARIMAAVYGFFKRQTAQNRIIIAEDIHWADELSLDLLDHLIHNFTGGKEEASSKLLVLANYRLDEPDAPPAFGKWLVSRRGERLRKIILKPLDPADLETLAQAALGEPRPLGDSARLRLHELTGGNPYFLLELLKNGIEAGSLKRDSAGDWSLSDWLKFGASSALPDSIDAALGQRIAALPIALQDALPAAAIWGRECDFSDWLALSGLPESELLDLADSAFKAGVLIERDADQFAFAHDLLRVKIISGISGLKLRRLHGKAVTRLTHEPKRAGREAARIARHALAAGSTAEAIRWGLLGADDLDKSFQYEAAAVLLESLKIFFDDPGEPQPASVRMEFLRLQCSVLRHLGKLAAAEHAGKESLAIARSLGAPSPFGQIIVALINNYNRRGQFSEALHLAETARQEIDALGDTLLRWNIESRMAFANLTLGRTAEVQARLATLAARLKRLPATEQLRGAGMIANLRSIMALYQGDFIEAAAQARAAMDIDERAGNLPGVAANQGNLGELELQLGRLDSAHTQLSAALKQNLTFGARNMALDNCNNLGQLEYYRGNLTEARRYLEVSVAAAREAGSKSFELDARGYLSSVLVREENFQAGRELLTGALTLSREMNSPVKIAAIHARIARLEIAAGNFDAATTAAGECISVSAGKFQDSEARARCALDAAQLLAGIREQGVKGQTESQKLEAEVQPPASLSSAPTPDPQPPTPVKDFHAALSLALTTKSVPLELEIRVDAARALLHARKFTNALELLGDAPQRAQQLGFKLFAAEALTILTAAQKQITD